MRMADSFELPDEMERLQINLEDDVRSFLIARLTGNQMDPKKRAQLVEQGLDVRRLSKPSYILVKSGCDKPLEDDSVHGCHVGAEGYMIHEDEAIVHLAFKCGDAKHEMHYTSFMPPSIVEMAKAMETVWPGSITGPLLDLLNKLGRSQPAPRVSGDTEINAAGAEKILKAIENVDDDDEFDEEDLDDVDIDEDLDEDEDEDEDLYL